ncbi:NAD-dependent 4,6-dehydratase LegB [Pseudodesulfovibrio pelocollis]|uniref:NAD-dependent 4,6-dehydratase LegB n=1 Tax=Pseudodesulfovibrio pelocollis TaxID=3051432 RepID=UPI00255A78B3|nr:NAD-dependent 4,6-dehydratase LegB [Pseudodesulfovibrio sp. SB368]
MKLANKKILVTGADGFIGSHLVERLVTAGHSVRALAHYNHCNAWGWLDTLRPDILSATEVVTGDIRDCGSVREMMKGIDVVFHLAALIAIPYSYSSPESYVQTNIMGTLNLLQAARHQGVDRFVHTSTSEVYGSAQFVPITEEHPLQGQSPYSATKIGADQMALSYYRSFEVPVAVLRPFNTYGPRQSARAVIPTIITQLANGAKSIKLGSLHPTRDFSYVTDTAEAFVSVAQSDTAVGEVLNAGSGFEISIGEVALRIAEVMDKEVAFEEDAQRVRPKGSEVERLFADNTRLRELTGWEPEYAGIEGFIRGLKETADWFSLRDNLSLYKADIYNV